LNNSELDNWLRHHSASFPAFAQWYHRQPNRGDIKGVWERIMADVTLADAIRITDQMASGDMEPPRGFGDHARAVRLAAKGIAAKRVKSTRRVIDGVPTFACRDCEDSGQLLVFHPLSMREMEEHDFKREYLLHIRRALPVICDCEAGQIIKVEWPPRLDRRKMVPATGGIDEMFDRLKSFIEEWKVRRTEHAPTYSPELAEWSK
jgi:hypothetical protein